MELRTPGYRFESCMGHISSEGVAQAGRASLNVVVTLGNWEAIAAIAKVIGSNPISLSVFRG